jgi:hypothetical protein
MGKKMSNKKSNKKFNKNVLTIFFISGFFWVIITIIVVNIVNLKNACETETIASQNSSPTQPSPKQIKFRKDVKSSYIER